MDPASGQVGDFCDHIIQWPGDFFTAGIGHDAKGAVFAATLHDGHEGTGALDLGLRKIVEFLDLRKTDIHNQCVAGSALL